MAIAQNKPMLIDFTGWACVSCREVEENIWPDVEVHKLIKEEYILTSLYVDDRTELPKEQQGTVEIKYDNGKVKIKKIKTIGDKWSTFETIAFKNNSQPRYALLSPDGYLLNNPISYKDIKENGYVSDDYLFKTNVAKSGNVPEKQDTFRNPFNELIEEVTGSRESGLSLHKSFRNGWIESVRSVVDGIPVDNVEAATGQYVGHKSLTTTDEYTGLITGQVVKPLSERKRAILSTFGYAANKLNIMANNQSKFKGGGEGKGRKKSTKKKVKNIIPRKATELTEEEIVQDKRNVFGSGKDIDEKVPFGTEEENLGGTIYGEKEKAEGLINIKDQSTKKEVRIKKELLYNHIVTELMNPEPTGCGCGNDDDDCGGECESGTCSC